jgi:hypothetical protein
MAKLTDFKTPTGVSGNLFDLKSIWGLVLGTIVLLFTFSMGQNLAKVVSGRVPAFDTTPERPYAVPPTQNKKVEVI